LQHQGRLFALFIALGLLSAELCGGVKSAVALECVPFARDVSGIALRGDAWRWWDEAAGRYERGTLPKVGSVAVFMKRGAMRHGHVAVVERVLDHRHVLVDHANWAPNSSRERGRVSRRVEVEDVSPYNDWTQVKVWNQQSRDFGTRTYPIYGFIYAPHAVHGTGDHASAWQPHRTAIVETAEAATMPVPDVSDGVVTDAIVAAPSAERGINYKGSDQS